MKIKLSAILIIGIFLISSIGAASTITKNISEETKDFFKVEKIKGHWRLIDPEGKPFFSTGICGVSSGSFYSPATDSYPYHENITRIYGSEENWAQATHDRMLEWNFNTIAYGDQYIIGTGLPYCIKLAMAGGNWITGEIPDYFSQEWEDYADNHAKEYLLPRLDDTNLIGYFLDNELHWGPDWRTLNDLIADYCSLPADSPGKQELVQFFKLRYRDHINEFNLAWLTSFKKFEEILQVSSIGFPITPKAISDRNAFAGLVAEQYFKTCYEKIRKYDKNHLILGARFQSYLTPLEVVKASAPYVDVVSANHYFANPLLYGPLKVLEELMDFTCPLDVLQEYYDLTGKPILISEFNIRAKDSGLPNTKPSSILFPVVNTQWQRADWFEYHITRFINKPYSVGYHWFSYNDEPATGRSDGEDSNTGIVSIEDRPYQPLVEKMTTVNKLAQESAKKSMPKNKQYDITYFDILQKISFNSPLLTRLLNTIF